MTTFPTAICIRLSLAAAILISTVSAPAVAAPAPQAQDAGQVDARMAAPATQPAPASLPSLGAVGFGWG